MKRKLLMQELPRMETGVKGMLLASLIRLFLSTAANRGRP